MTNYTRIIDSLRDNPCESAAEAIERLQAELAECQRERDRYDAIAGKLLLEKTALALRVKELEEALGSIREYWNRDQNESAMADACWHAVNTADEALASTDKTAEEVIAEYERNKWGDPVGESVVNALKGDFATVLSLSAFGKGTKLYATRTEVTK